MFSIRQKRLIAWEVQKILRDTNHPELPKNEISFTLYVEGKNSVISYAHIRNNGAVDNPSVNPWNEEQDCPHEWQKHEAITHVYYKCKKCNRRSDQDIFPKECKT